MKIYPIPLSFLLSLSVLHIEAKEIELRPGQLPAEMANVIASEDQTLVLTGTATPYDLTSLRVLPDHVVNLDLSRLTIRGDKTIDREWFGRTEFADGEIPAYMLLGTNVSVVRMPAAVSEIGRGAFSGIPIKEFSATGVNKIGEAAFYNCSQLKKVDFQNSTFTEVPTRLFSGCAGLEDLHLPSHITAVGDRAFEKCNLSVVSIPYAKKIGDYAFAYASSLNEIHFSQGCVMGEGVFYGAGSLESLPCDPGNTPELFSVGNDMEVLSVKTSTVGEGAYSGSYAETIWLGPELNSIGPYAFHSMPRLKKVVAGSSVIPEAHPDAFAGNDLSEIFLYVNRGEGDRWRSAPVWRDFKITEDTSGVEEIIASDTSANVLKIDRRGDKIVITSAAPIEEVAIYSVGGETISTTTPHIENHELEYPSGYDVVIVKAIAGKGVNVVKLTK